MSVEMGGCGAGLRGRSRAEGTVTKMKKTNVLGLRQTPFWLCRQAQLFFRYVWYAATASSSQRSFSAWPAWPRTTTTPTW